MEPLEPQSGLPSTTLSTTTHPEDRISLVTVPQREDLDDGFKSTMINMLKSLKLATCHIMDCAAVVHTMYAALLSVHTFGIHIFLRRSLHYRPYNMINVYWDRRTDAARHSTHGGTAPSQQEQWGSFLATTASYWSPTCKGCGLALMSSLGLLQFNETNSNIYTRTTALAALIYSGFGLITAGIYILAESHAYFRKDDFRDKWVAASEGSNKRTAIDFWASLSLPISSLVWSTFFLVATVTTTIFLTSTLRGTSGTVNPRKYQSSSYNNVEVSLTITTVLLAILVTTQAVQLYRAVKLIFT